MQRIERRHEIFADAAAHQFAIEFDIVDAADDEDLRRRIADIGEPVDFLDRGLCPASRVSMIRRLGVGCRV